MTEQEARGCPMDNQANVVVDTNRPEIRVARSIKPMKAETAARQVSCRSNAVVLTAFCSTLFSRATLAVKVSAMRNSTETADHSQNKLSESLSRVPSINRLILTSHRFQPACPR